MKHNKLVLGGLGLTALALAATIVSNLGSKVEAKYSAENGILDQNTSANGYYQFIQSKMIDHETGEVITSDKLREVMDKLSLQPKSLNVEWKEMGPDNIGGRTRAVLVDRFNQNRVWSGGVTGGLYKSEHRANWWERVSNFPGNQFISHIVQDASGNTYVGTGSLPEGGLWTGNGLYVTPDNGDTWELVPGTGNFNHINRMASNRENNVVFIAAGSNGLYKYTYGGTLEPVSGYGSSNAQTVACSDNGELVVVSDQNNRTWVSNDAGNTFENKTGSGSGQISSAGSRTEYAISKLKSDGTYSIYASKSASNNSGQWISLNSGNTWHMHTPATGANIDNGVIDFRNQGGWNNIASFDPTDPKRVIIGGIDLHEWVQVIDNPPSGGWNKISLWFVSPTSPIYVHADNHALFWDESNTLFVGNDGGIQISEDKGETYYEANRGYNIAQFFKIAYDRHGGVLGGTQDNGGLYNNLKNHSYQEFKRVTGGDGFSTAISFYNPRVLFSSSQYNNITRSSDAGEIFNSFIPPFPGAYGPVGGEGGGNHPFHTMFVLAEYYDENSEDSLIFIPQASYGIGEVIPVPSRATGDTIEYITPTEVFFDDTLYYFPDSTRIEYVVTDENSGLEYDLGFSNFSYFPTASGNYPPANGDSLLVDTPLGTDTVVVASSSPYNFYVGVNTLTNQAIDMGRDTVIFNVPWDTLTVQDPFQSWFVVSTTANGGEIWGTRDALRFSTDPRWVRLADNLGGAALDMEFSEDMNHLFICGGQFIGSTQHSTIGRIFRLDGLGSVYTSDPNFIQKTSIDQGATATNLVTVSSSSVWNGIGIDPRNPDILVATQGFNGNVFRSSNATSASPTLTQVGSQGGNSFYDVVVDRDDSDILFAATFTGVSASEDGGATWSDVSDPSFQGTPAYHILQSWRTWDEGNRKPGAIFVGTHGRGIFSTEAVLNTVNEDKEETVVEKPKSTLEVYPNPARYNSTLVVDLKRESNVNVLFFNLNGSVVKRIDRTNMHVGKNEIFFSASDLPQGTYIIRVQAGDQIETTKYIKM